MKRCPNCLFIYPDSDTRCDFDGTPLVEADEAELEPATTTKPNQATKPKRRSTTHKPSSNNPETKPKRSAKKRARKTTALTAVAILFFAVAAFVIYYRASHRHNLATTATQNIAQLPAPPITSVQQIATPIPSSPSPLTTATASPTTTPTQPSTKPATDRIATAHTTTPGPISTSGRGVIKNGKATILLTSGSKLSADEVWRTRDGVWYRRDGIVTLLKRGQIKAIINQ